MCNLSQAVWEDGIQEGIQQGIQQGKVQLVIKKVRKNKPMDVIADEMEAEPWEIQPIYDAVVQCGPDYNQDEICSRLSPQRI